MAKTFFALLACLGGIFITGAGVAEAQAPAAPPPAGAPSVTSGPVQAGDLLTIFVVGEPLLSGERRVDADGTVTLPRAGQVRVVGLTPAQASRAIARVIEQKKLLKIADVTVSITESEKPRVVTVAGAVNAAGSFPLQTRMTLLQAVAKARGPIEGARQNAVEVTRIAPDGASKKQTYDITKAANATVEVRPGDYIFVPYPRRRPDTNIISILGAAGTLFYLLGR